MTMLNKQVVGSLCTIQNINLPINKKIKLLGLGISNTKEIKVLRNRSGDLIVGIGNGRIGIGRNLSRYIEVV